MTALWHYFWPVYAACLAIGLLAGAVAFRRPAVLADARPGKAISKMPSYTRNGRTVITLGGAVALMVAMLWYFPLGAADRMSGRIDTIARISLDHYELPMVHARLERRPLTRRLVLSGPADDFQRRELVRIMNEVPGVAEVAWDPGFLEAEAAQ